MRRVEAYNGVGAEALMCAGLDTGFFNEFDRAARNAENYGGNNNSEGYTNMVDIGDLVRKADALLPQSGAALLSALEEAVVYQVKGEHRSEAGGLSCYYSYNGDKEDFEGYVEVGASPTFRYFYDYAISGRLGGEGIGYIEEYAAEYTDEPIDPQEVNMPDKNSLEDFPVTIDQDGVAVLNLGAEIAGKLAGVYFNLAYIDEDSGSAVFLGLDNDLEMDWESGVFKDNFRGAWGSIDGALVYMEISDETDEYQIYSVPILLNGEEYTLNVSYVYQAGQYKILGAHKGISDSGMGDKNQRMLVSGDIIEPLHYVMNNIESNTDDDFEQTAFEKIVVTDKTTFEETDLGDGLFLFVFEMRDIQSNSYLSNAVVFTVKDGEIYAEGE